MRLQAVVLTKKVKRRDLFNTKEFNSFLFYKVSECGITIASIGIEDDRLALDKQTEEAHDIVNDEETLADKGIIHGWGTDKRNKEKLKNGIPVGFQC